MPRHRGRERNFSDQVSFFKRKRTVVRKSLTWLETTLQPPSIGGEWVHFPMYHHVLDDERRGFDRQLRYLRRFGDFLDADDAVDALARPGGIGGRYFCITFDDGFKDSLTNALPVLIDRKCPAIFFLATDYIGLDLDADWDQNPTLSAAAVALSPPVRVSDLGRLPGASGCRDDARRSYLRTRPAERSGRSGIRPADPCVEGPYRAGIGPSLPSLRRALGTTGSRFRPRRATSAGARRGLSIVHDDRERRQRNRRGPVRDPTHRRPRHELERPTSTPDRALMKLRDATLQDHDAIMAVHRRNGLVELDAERWCRRWTENPFRAAVPGLPIGWVLTDDAGAVVGTIGNVPVGYEWNGRRLTAAVVSMWAVDAPYRNSSIGLAAKFFQQKGVDLLLNTTANQAAGAVFAAFRAERVPCPSYADRLLWITNYAGVAASVLRRRGVPGAALWKHPAALALWSVDRLKQRNRRGRTRGAVRVASTLDARFDAFWERLRRRPDTLRAVRDRDALAWHQELARGRAPSTILVLEDGPASIAGYVSLVRRDQADLGLRRLEVADLQALGDDPGPVLALVAGALEHASAEGIDLVGLTGPTARARAPSSRSAPLRDRFHPPGRCSTRRSIPRSAPRSGLATPGTSPRSTATPSGANRTPARPARRVGQRSATHPTNSRLNGCHACRGTPRRVRRSPPAWPCA